MACDKHKCCMESDGRDIYCPVCREELFAEEFAKTLSAHDEKKKRELRDQFAMASLHGIRAGKYKTGGAYPSESTIWTPEAVAKQAYRDADAMMKEREK